jgi:hypothetical protein
MRTGKGIGLALLAICGFAFGLRWTGLDKLQPHLQEADAHIVQQMRVHRSGPVDLARRPHAYVQYPTLMARVMALMPKARVSPDAALDEHLATASADFVRMRAAIALLSALLVPLTWLFARRFVGPGAALLAAALIALSVLHLLFSQQARLHGPQATFALLGVLASMGLRRNPSPGWYALAALALALAVGSLHNGFAVAAPIVVAHFTRDKTRGGAPGWALAPLAIPTALVLYFFYPRPPTVQDEGGLLEFGGHKLPFDKLDGSGFARCFEYLWNYEPALLILAAAGGLMGLARLRRAPGVDARRRGDLVVAAAYALPYLLAVGLMGLTQDRFLLPLLPFLAALAAGLVVAVPGRAARVGVALAALAFPGYTTLRYVQVRSAPDTVERAAAWVAEHLEPETRVVLSPRLTLPLFHDAQAIGIADGDGANGRTIWMRYQIHNAPQSGPRYALLLTPARLTSMGREHAPEELSDWLEQAQPAYAILEVSRLTGFIPQMRSLRELVRERGTLEAVIRGEDERWQTEPPLDYQEIPAFVRRILAADSFGPCIEIYRL